MVHVHFEHSHLLVYLYFFIVVKPALRQSTGSALEATRLETTVDIARYSVSAVATEVSRLINDARAVRVMIVLLLL